MAIRRGVGNEELFFNPYIGRGDMRIHGGAVDLKKIEYHTYGMGEHRII